MTAQVSATITSIFTASRADLESAFAENLSPPRDSVSQSSLSLTRFTDQDLRFWIARLHKLRSECGCSLGARFSAAALLGTIAFVATSLRAGTGPWGVAVELVLGIAATVIAGGVGKTIGILRARAQLRAVRRRLLADIRRTEEEHLDVYVRTLDDPARPRSQPLADYRH